MKPEQILAVAVRLFAIALGIYLLNMLKGYAALVAGKQFDFATLTYLVTMLCLGILAILLWKFPVVVAKGISGFSLQGEKEITTLKYEELLQIGLIVLGMYLLFNVISDLSYWLIVGLLIARDHQSGYVLLAGDKASIVVTFIELAFVMVVLLGNNKLAKIFRRLRYGSS
jgi:hypothetical protein